MLSDADVLTSLSEAVSPGELSLALKRLLRVPAAWRFLHQTEILHDVIEQGAPEFLHLSRLAALAIGTTEKELSTAPLQEALDLERQHIVDSVKSGKSAGELDFQELSLLAVDLLRQTGEELQETLRESPQTWALPFAIAWSRLDSVRDCMAVLVSSGDTRALKAACCAVLANMAPAEAAEWIASILGEDTSHLLPRLLQIGEIELARELAREIEDSPVEPPGPESAVHLYKVGLKKLSLADSNEARQAFEQAWDTTYQLSACIADNLADLARNEGDHVFEAEAARQALEAQPTAARRARHARALLDLGRVDEALNRLPESDQSPFEQVVQAQLLARSGDQTEARRTAKEAAQSFPSDETAENVWIADLLECLERLGLISNALNVALAWVQREPASVMSRVHLSHTLAKAGLLSEAVDQAQLALSLDPDDRLARITLASKLQLAGDAQSALPLWHSITDEDQGYRPELIDCALDAEEIALALQQAEDHLEKNPDSSVANVLLAKAESAAGESNAAIELLEDVIASETASEDAWILLASMRRDLHEEDYAATLAAGIQSQPTSARLHYTYAKYLHAEGAPTEALDHFQRAVNLSPEVAAFNGAYGSLLFELGHAAQALSYLEEASIREPGNWETKTSLARAYIHTDRLTEAAELLSDLPDEGELDQHLLAGEVLTNASRKVDPQFALPALKHLQIAVREGGEESDLDLWMAQALEQSGDHHQAFDKYQAFLKHAAQADTGAQLESVLGQARTAMALNKASLAVTILEQIRPDHCDSTAVLLLLSAAYRQENLLQQAVDCAQQALEAAPENTEALRMLADLEEERKAWKNAAEITKQLTDLEPVNIDAWLLYADRSIKADSEPAFRDAIAKALWLARSTPESLVAIAERLRQHGTSPSALRVIRRALNASMDAPITVLKQIAGMASDLGDHATASKAWMSITQHAPDDASSLAGAAESLWMAEMKEKAIHLWQKAVRQDSHDAELRVRLAEALVQTGEIQQGLEHYVGAIALEPESAMLALQAGRVFAKHGTKEEALGYLRRAVELNPSCDETRTELAQVLFEEGRIEEVEVEIERVISQPAPPSKALALAAMVDLERERLPTAMQHLSQAENAQTPSPSVNRWLAKAEMRFGRWEKAVTAYQAALAEKLVPEIALDYIRALLRMLDANWLYADYANAYAHAPNTAVSVDQIQTDIGEMIQKLEENSVGGDELSTLQRWLSLHDPESRLSAAEALHANGEHRWEGELAHAYAVAQLAMAQPEQALLQLEDASVFNPDAWGALLVGVARCMQGEQSEARRAYKLAQRNPVVRPLALRLEGRSWESEGETGRAIQLTGDALSAWPDEPAWHYELGQLYTSGEAIDAALPHLQQAVELAPSEMEYLITLARLLRRTGQLAEAEAVYARVVQKRPASGQIWKEAAQVSLDVGKVDQAEKWFERAQILSPSDAQCIIGAAQAAMEMGKTEKAMDLSQRATRLSPEDVEVLLGLGEIHSRRGKYEQALDAYDKALHMSEDPLTVQLARAKVLVSIGRPGQAVSDIRLSLDRAPQDHRLWSALAEACEANDDLDYAVESASKALRMAPRNPTYHLLYGRLARKSGQLDIALDELTQAHAALPQNPAVHYELGRVYEARRQYSKALEAFRESLRLEGASRATLFHTGLVLKQLKAYRDAGQMFERAVEIDPRDPEALHQLAAVRALQLVHGGIPQTMVQT